MSPSRPSVVCWPTAQSTARALALAPAVASRPMAAAPARAPGPSSAARALVAARAPCPATGKETPSPRSPAPVLCSQQERLSTTACAPSLVVLVALVDALALAPALATGATAPARPVQTATFPLAGTVAPTAAAAISGSRRWSGCRRARHPGRIQERSISAGGRAIVLERLVQHDGHGGAAEKASR